MVLDWFGETYLPDNTDLTSGVNLFVDYLPDEGDCIVLFEERGVREDYMREYASNSVGMMLYCRGTNEFKVQHMQAVENVLDNLSERAGSDFWMKLCSQESSTQFIGRDKRGRKEWSAHYLVLVNVLTSENRQDVIPKPPAGFMYLISNNQIATHNGQIVIVPAA